MESSNQFKIFAGSKGMALAKGIFCMSIVSRMVSSAPILRNQFAESLFILFNQPALPATISWSCC